MIAISVTFPEHLFNGNENQNYYLLKILPDQGNRHLTIAMAKATVSTFAKIVIVNKTFYRNNKKR